MEVWQEILEDEEAGAKRLVAEYKDRLTAAARYLVRDDSEAEDLVFRTFIQAIQHIREHRPESSFYGWLHAILLNFCRSVLRKEAKSPIVTTPDIPDVADDGKSAPEQLVLKSDIHLLRLAIVDLPLMMREVIVLRYFEELTLDEIARIVEAPVGTVKSRLFEAKRVLCGLLQSKYHVK